MATSKDNAPKINKPGAVSKKRTIKTTTGKAIAVKPAAKGSAPATGKTKATAPQPASAIRPPKPASTKPVGASTAAVPADAPVLVKSLIDYFVSRMAVFQPDKLPQLVDLLNEKNKQIGQLTEQLAVEVNPAMKARHQALADSLQNEAGEISNLIETLLVHGQKTA